MTLKVLKSHILGTNFELQVAHFAQEMRDWRAHMNRVAEDEKNEVSGIDKHMAYARPTASDLVDAAVDENGNTDFEIVDDGPTSEQILDRKKQALFVQVYEAEVAAGEKIVPAAKRRLFNLQESAIYSADEKLATDLKKKKKGRIAKVWDAALGKDVDAVAVEAADLRSARAKKDNDHLDAQNERREKINSLVLLAAQAIADIQDLTADNVDDWKLPNFDV